MLIADWFSICFLWSMCVKQPYCTWMIYAFDGSSFIAREWYTHLIAWWVFLFLSFINFINFWFDLNLFMCAIVLLNLNLNVDVFLICFRTCWCMCHVIFFILYCFDCWLILIFLCIKMIYALTRVNLNDIWSSVEILILI